MDGAKNAGVWGTGELSQTEAETAEEVDGRTEWKAGVQEVVPPPGLAPALVHGGGFVKRGRGGGRGGGARDAGVSLAPACRGR
jgi:hypothetical protein